MENYDTLVEAMEAYRKEGYTDNLRLEKDHLVSGNNEITLRKNDFTIDKIYRYEGMTNPSDQTILYAISSEKYDIKGQLVHAYGVYSEDVDEDMLEKLTC